MPFRIVRDNLINVHADAIVNAASTRPVIGDGVDRAIYEAAGKASLLAERRKIGTIKRGDAAATPAFALPAKFVIHTAGPRWLGGHFGERRVLASCYRNSLALAASLGCESIALPLLAAGVHRFPEEVALAVAISEIKHFLEDSENEMDVTLVVLNRNAYKLSAALMDEVQSFIDEQTVQQIRQMEYPFGVERANSERRMLSRSFEDERMAPPQDAGRMAPPPDAGRMAPLDDWEELPVLGAGAPSYAAGMDEWRDELPEDESCDALRTVPIEDAIFEEHAVMPDFSEVGMSFRDKLFELIDARGLTDPEVYKRANIDRKLFSKIRNSETYTPKKKTALALAVALRLPLDETADLISRAGYALSPSSQFDMIIKYFIEKGDYDIYTINATLFAYDQPLLGL